MKRQKGKNFSDNEISLLLDLIEEKLNIIENKKTDGNTVKQKNLAWEDIANNFNASNINEERSVNQLKTFYDNYKRKTRKDIDQDKNKKLDSNGEKLMNMMKNQFRADKNLFDSTSSVYPLDEANTSAPVYHSGEENTNKNQSVTGLFEEKFIAEKKEESNKIGLEDNIDVNRPKSTDRKRTSTLYGTLEKLTSAKSLKNDYKVEYIKLKLDLKRERIEKLKEESSHMRRMFQLQEKKLENELILQDIKIEQERLKTEIMKKQ